MKGFERNALLIKARILKTFSETLGITTNSVTTADVAAAADVTAVFTDRYGLTPLEQMVATNHAMAAHFQRSVAATSAAAATSAVVSSNHLKSFFMTQGGLATMLLDMDERWNPHEIVSIMMIDEEYDIGSLILFGAAGCVIRVSDRVSMIQRITEALPAAKQLPVGHDHHAMMMIIHNHLLSIVRQSIFGLIMADRHFILANAHEEKLA